MDNRELLDRIKRAAERGDTTLDLSEEGLTVEGGQKT